MAEVFLTRQEGIAGVVRFAVLKKILPQYSSVANVAEMLLDEARIAAHLNHPNVVQIYELGQEGSQYFIAMEYVDGCDLATLARIERHRHSRVPLRLSLRVVTEAAMGLDYAHRQTGLDGKPLNIVHRDVSPHNILCSREGAVKLTDFGIAKAVNKEQVTDVGVVKGKVQYMAPEQYTGSEVDARSDIFSLGVVLYQLTTGRLPRVTPSGDLAVRRVIDGDIPPPTEIRADYPEGLEGIVMRALARRADDRFDTAAEFRDELLDFARKNDLLAFPKELGDYVDELVPRQPLTDLAIDVSESVIVSSGIKKNAQPSDSTEERDTGPPAGTEVVSKRGAARAAANEQEADTTTVFLNDDAAATDADATPASAVFSAALAEDRQENIRTSSGHYPEGIAVPPDRRSGSAEFARGSQDVGAERSQRSWVPALTALVVVAVAAVVIVYLNQRSIGPVDPQSPPHTPQAGAIELSATPKTARVEVDGAQRCAVTPCRIGGLPLGRELLITVRSPGYLLWMQRVVLTQAEPKMLIDAQLRSADKNSKPQTDAATAKATSSRQSKRNTQRQANPAGNRATKKASSKGPRPQRGTGKVSSVSIPGKQAVLVVDVRPAWAEVYVDGTKMGHTPLQTVLEPGRRKVVLRNEELKFNRLYTVRAVAGKKVKISDSIPRPESPEQ